MSDNKPQSIEDKIMADIESGKVKLRSKYIFLAEKFGLSSVVVLSILLAILFCNLALFYLRSTDNLVYLSFGKRGIYAFLESFPYLLVIGLIISIFAAGALIKKSGWFYKKPYTYTALSLLGGVIMIGAALSYTRVAEFIETQCYYNNMVTPVVSVFLHRNLGERSTGISGRVIEAKPDSLRLQTPREIRTVIFAFPPVVRFQPGVFVVAVGEWEGGAFRAYQIRIIDEEELPVIQRNINMRFGELRSVPHY